MLSLIVEDKELTIKDIDKTQLPKIIEWFSGDSNCQYRYALGIDKPIGISDLYEKYLEVLTSTHEFFLSINIYDNFVGFVKGRADYRAEGEIWIMSMLIDESYQSKGIGRRVLNSIMNEFKDKLGIKRFYACLINDNKRAKVFWERNGFSEFRSTRGYFKIGNKSYDLMIMQR